MKNKIVDASLEEKAIIINALINVMKVNKKDIGCYHSLMDNSLEKLNKIIKSIE